MSLFSPKGQDYRQDSMMTLGDAATQEEASPTPDDRLKPMSLRRHKHGDYEQYLVTHTQESPKNVKAIPYSTDEQGRGQKTQILDHIIKAK